MKKHIKSQNKNEKKKDLYNINSIKRNSKKHLKKEKGMSNIALQRLAFLICSKDFKGVYCSDELPTKLPLQGSFMLIVNLGKKKNVSSSGHFVNIIASPSRILYIDSYGFPCKEEKTLTFLRRCNRKVFYNTQQLQSYNSNNCAAYTLLYTIYFDPSTPTRQRNFKLKFYDKHLKLNDKLCYVYLKKMLRAKEYKDLI